MLRALLCLFVCFLFATVAFAQEGKVDVEEEVVTTSAPDVSTASIFPHFPAKKFFVGEPVEILLGFVNSGEESYDLTHITASFNYPLDYSYYIQNFTAREYNVSVKPSTQVSLAYTFLPDPLLEPRDFGLVCSVHYRDSQGNNFTSVFFNSTVDMIEHSGGVDTQTFFVGIFALAFFGLIGFVIYRYLSSWSKRQGYTGGGSSDEGTTQSLDNDWLQGTSAEVKRRKKKDN